VVSLVLRRDTQDDGHRPLHAAQSSVIATVIFILRWFVFDIPGMANSNHVRISVALRSDELGEVKSKIRMELQTLAIVVSILFPSSGFFPIIFHDYASWF